MAQRMVVVQECDNCGTESDIVPFDEWDVEIDGYRASLDLCDDCSMRLATPLMTLVMKVGDLKDRTCPECQFVAVSKGGLTQHMKKHA